MVAIVADTPYGSIFPRTVGIGYSRRQRQAVDRVGAGRSRVVVLLDQLEAYLVIFGHIGGRDIVIALYRQAVQSLEGDAAYRST